MRHRSEAVDKPLTVSVKFLIVLNIIKFAIQQHTLRCTRYILIGIVHLKIALQGTVVNKLICINIITPGNLFGIEILKFIVLQFSDCLRKNLLIHLISEVFHESTLLRTKKISCPSYVKILHGKGETGAKIRECLQRFQTSFGIGIQRAERRREQIAERFFIGTAHTTTHLMQVRQSKAMCVVDDYGIGIRYVDAILYDSGRDKYVVIIVHETYYNLLQFLRSHLTMTYGDPAVRYVFFYQFGNSR